MNLQGETLIKIYKNCRITYNSRTECYHVYTASGEFIKTDFLAELAAESFIEDLPLHKRISLKKSPACYVVYVEGTYNLRTDRADFLRLRYRTPRESHISQADRFTKVQVQAILKRSPGVHAMKEITV